MAGVNCCSLTPASFNSCVVVSLPLIMANRNSSVDKKLSLFSVAIFSAEVSRRNRLWEMPMSLFGLLTTAKLLISKSTLLASFVVSTLSAFNTLLTLESSVLSIALST